MRVAGATGERGRQRTLCIFFARGGCRNTHCPFPHEVHGLAGLGPAPIAQAPLPPGPVLFPHLAAAPLPPLQPSLAAILAMPQPQPQPQPVSPPSVEAGFDAVPLGHHRARPKRISIDERGDAQGGFGGDAAQGGFGGDAQGGFGEDAHGGFGGDAQGRFGGDAQGGYAPHAEAAVLSPARGTPTGKQSLPASPVGAGPSKGTLTQVGKWAAVLKKQAHAAEELSSKSCQWIVSKVIPPPSRRDTGQGDATVPVAASEQQPDDAEEGDVDPTLFSCAFLALFERAQTASARCKFIAILYSLVIVEAKADAERLSQGEPTKQCVWRMLAGRHALSLSLMYSQIRLREANDDFLEASKEKEARAGRERSVVANVWKDLAQRAHITPEVAHVAERVLASECSEEEERTHRCDVCCASGLQAARKFCLQATPIPQVHGGWLGGLNPNWEVLSEQIRSVGELDALNQHFASDELCAECCVFVYGWRWHEVMSLVQSGMVALEMNATYYEGGGGLPVEAPPQPPPAPRPPPILLLTEDAFPERSRKASATSARLEDGGDESQPGSSATPASLV
ncbi:hypothetical protein T492DRAFT_1047768, partial [Pavlovales sp. CCMP2436]